MLVWVERLKKNISSNFSVFFFLSLDFKTKKIAWFIYFVKRFSVKVFFALAKWYRFQCKYFYPQHTLYNSPNALWWRGLVLLLCLWRHLFLWLCGDCVTGCCVPADDNIAVSSPFCCFEGSARMMCVILWASLFKYHIVYKQKQWNQIPRCMFIILIFHLYIWTLFWINVPAV